MNANDFEREVEQDLAFVNALLELNDDNLAHQVIANNDVQNALLSLQWYLEAMQKGEIIYCPVKPGDLVYMHDLAIRAKDEPSDIDYLFDKKGKLIGTVDEITYLQENQGRISVSYWVNHDGRMCEYEREYNFDQFGRDVTLVEHPEEV